MARKKTVLGTANDIPGISSIARIWFLGITGILGIGLAAGYVYLLPKLIAFGAEDRGFYILLLLWGLCCAGFLFGALRGYAQIIHKHLGTKIELGGPAALFAAVVVGGFLLPPSKESFALTVRAHSADQPKITTGQVTLECVDFRRTEQFSNGNGEANFKGIPRSCWGNDQTRFLPEVSGLCQEWQTVIITTVAIDLALKECALHLRGRVIPIPPQLKDVKIIIDDGKQTSGLDAGGQFDIPVITATGSVHLQVFVGAKNIYDSYQTVPGTITIPFQKL